MITIGVQMIIDIWGHSNQRLLSYAELCCLPEQTGSIMLFHREPCSERTIAVRYIWRRKDKVRVGCLQPRCQGAGARIVG